MSKKYPRKKINIEVTDTFGGEVNYGWVKRYTIEVREDATDRSLIQAAKQACGYTGVKCNRDDYDGITALWVRGQCVVIFISEEQAH